MEIGGNFKHPSTICQTNGAPDMLDLRLITKGRNILNSWGIEI